MLTEEGRKVGFNFHYFDEMKMLNTHQCHQLLHWANELGRKHDLKQALFTAHFTHGRNLSDDAVLVEIADEIGLGAVAAKAVLEDQRFAAVVRQEQQFWIQQGISGVPAFVFDRQHLVMGAQGVENFKSILTQLRHQDA